MNELPFFYNRVSPPTWIVLSAILTLAVFFKFSRLWSVRNLDLVVLIVMAPGLWFAHEGHALGIVGAERGGYLWLFVATLWFLGRALMDSAMVRRPLLEANLSAGGLTFLGCAMFAFLMANVLTGEPAPEEGQTVAAAPSTAAAPPKLETPPTAGPAGTAPASSQDDRLARQGPGYPPLFRAPNIVTQFMLPPPTHPAKRGGGDATPGAESPPGRDAVQNPALRADLLPMRILLISLQVAMVLGFALVGFRHFDNLKTGIAVAVLYLMLPYTAQFIGQLRHEAPAALLLWAIVAYRRPVVAGFLLGVAIGLSYYPLFLLPLWLSFYWPRGLLRFLSGLLPGIGLLVGLLIWAPAGPDHAALATDLRQMFGVIFPQTQAAYFEGFWAPALGLGNPAYRLPILAAFIALSASMAIWPAQKNLGTLISCSAAIMLAAQFWNPHRGGVYVGWYIAPLLLMVFRPNLEDRVALSVITENWIPKRRAAVKRIERVA